MIKKFIDTIILLISSGAVFHRCTFLGALCAAWVVFGTAEDGNMFRRLFTGVLYLFMGAFVVFYRLVFKKTLTGRGDPDLQATAVYALGDFAHAVLAMFCVTFFLSSFIAGDKSATTQQIQTIRRTNALMHPRF